MVKVCWNLEGGVVQKGLWSESTPLQTEISFSSSQGLFRTTEKPNKILGRRVRAQSLSKSHPWAGVSLVHWFPLRHMVIMTRGEWFYGSFMSTLIHFLPRCCRGVHFLSLWRGSIFSICSWELFLVTKPNSQRSPETNQYFNKVRYILFSLLSSLSWEIVLNQLIPKMRLYE